MYFLNNWAQIYNKGYSVIEFLFSLDNKVSQRDYNNFPSQSLYLTRYKNCPYRKSLVKEKSNSSKFKRRQDLDMISKLFSKTRKLKTILKIMNMKAIFAVMKLIRSIQTNIIVIDSQLYKYIRQTVTFSLHRNYLDAAIDQERKYQLNQSAL